MANPKSSEEIIASLIEKNDSLVMQLRSSEMRTNLLEQQVSTLQSENKELKKSQELMQKTSQSEAAQQQSNNNTAGIFSNDSRPGFTGSERKDASADNTKTFNNVTTFKR